jgi:5-(hydroxymethyl)furfural/furfural oxidase
MDFDFIIVGAGTAGCVLAHRLSADPSCRVLLVEAGADMPEGKIPEALLDSYPGGAYINPDYTWNRLRITTDIVKPNNKATARRKPYEQARVMGGGSSINGQLANRGTPEDYDEWQARGAQGWGWSDVLPYFRKLERDMDFEGPLHGKEGRMPIRRVFPNLWPKHALAVAAALKSAGMKWLPDQNGEVEEGYFPIAISNAYERRVSAATAYLDPVTRLRPNLTILTETFVSQLLFEGTRCNGVELTSTGQTRFCTAGEVIVSCGAVNTPGVLMRAGIGPAESLRALGIPVLADRPGVGRGLMDHPTIALASFIKPHARVNSNTRRHILLGWRYSSRIGNEPNDMFVVAASRTAWHAVGEQIGTLLLIVNKTFSDSGVVTLRSKDWQDDPEVHFNLLSDPRDMERMEQGFLRLAELYQRAEIDAVVSDPFPAVWGDKVRQVGKVSIRNRWLTGLAARLLDGPATLRRSMMKNFIAGNYQLKDVIENPDRLRAFIREAVVGAWHASSSCRMGSSSDAMAVTDEQGRVYGVSGLRIDDASIFPTIPRANLNIPVLMVAEKIADEMIKASNG